MGAFELSRVIDAPVEWVWGIVTDWEGYGARIPLTRIRVDPGATRVGWSFAGLTGLGPLRFSDSMIITQWEPPAVTDRPRFRLVKTGRLLAGWAEVQVVPLGPASCRLEWRESIVVKPVTVGRLLAPVLDPLNRRLFASTVEAIAREATA